MGLRQLFGSQSCDFYRSYFPHSNIAGIINLINSVETRLVLYRNSGKTNLKIRTFFNYKLNILFYLILRIQREQIK